MLSINHLTKHFGGVKAVEDCTFGIDEGRITALIGPNGAGKTTVFNLVSGVFLTDDGSILFHGKDITHLPIYQRSRLGLSRTFQLSRLFRNLSIEDNLLLALREHDDNFFQMFWHGTQGDQQEKQRIREMMDFVGLQKNSETLITDLSYGQQKLFDLCRALLNPHKFLMLDEPVAGVHPDLRGQLKRILLSLKAQGKTILLIEHDMDFVRAVADHIIVMDQGRVLIHGEPTAVLMDRSVLEAYLGV